MVVPATLPHDDARRRWGWGWHTQVAAGAGATTAARHRRNADADVNEEATFEPKTRELGDGVTEARGAPHATPALAHADLAIQDRVPAPTPIQSRSGGAARMLV